MHAATVAQASPAFRRAVARGDAGEALRLGRVIMYACQQHQLELGSKAAKWAVWARLGAFFGQAEPRVNTDEVRHYQLVQETVSLALQQMGIASIDADMSCIDPADEGEQVSVAADDRAAEIGRITASLRELSTMYSTVHDVVRRSDPYVTSLTGTIDGLEPRLNRAEDALLQYYADKPPPRGCLARATTCLCPSPVLGILMAGTAIVLFVLHQLQ